MQVWTFMTSQLSLQCLGRNILFSNFYFWQVGLKTYKIVLPIAIQKFKKLRYLP